MSTLPDRVTKCAIEAKIAAVNYIHRPNNSTLTICLITMDNGIVVTGESACVDPNNYAQHLGEQYAYEDAFGKLWMPMGFLLAEDRLRERT